MEKIKINGRTRLKVYEDGSVDVVIHKTENFEEIAEKVEEEKKRVEHYDGGEILFLDINAQDLSIFAKDTDENEGGQK